MQCLTTGAFEVVASQCGIIVCDNAVGPQEIYGLPVPAGTTPAGTGYLQQCNAGHGVGGDFTRQNYTVQCSDTGVLTAQGRARSWSVICRR